MLAALGDRVDKGRVFKRRPVVDGEGIWHRVAVFVMRRPLPIALAAIALLLFLGAPFLGLKLGLPDDRVLSESSEVRVAHQYLRDEFTAGEAAPVQVIVPNMSDPDDASADATAADFNA